MAAGSGRAEPASLIGHGKAENEAHQLVDTVDRENDVGDVLANVAITLLMRSSECPSEELAKAS